MNRNMCTCAWTGYEHVHTQVYEHVYAQVSVLVYTQVYEHVYAQEQV